MNAKQKILLLTCAKFAYMQNLRICKSLPCVQGLRAKKTFIRKKLGHTMVSAIKASSVTLLIWQKEPEEKTVNLQIIITAVVSKTDMSQNTKIFQIC